MSRSTVSVLLIALVIVGLAILAWVQVSKLSEQIAGLEGQVDVLGDRLVDAEERAGAAEERAAAAEMEADEALGLAAAASERELVSTQRAREAELARQEAEEREQRAARAKLEAERRADEEAAQRAAAEERRAAAEREKAESVLEMIEARAEARRARAETDRIRRRMERELDRLEGALGKIAETKRNALGLVMTLDGSQIEFDFDKAELRPENREVLSRIAGVLMTFQDYGVQIVGHTDDVGSVEYNQELSERRAEAVREYLLEAGIEDSVVTTEGRGKLSPLVEGTDDQSRQRNRRVELLIVFSEGEYEGLTDEELAGDGLDEERTEPAGSS